MNREPYALKGASTVRGGEAHLRFLLHSASPSASVIWPSFSTPAAGKLSAMPCQNAWIRRWHWQLCIQRSKTESLLPAAFITRTAGVKAYSTGRRNTRLLSRFQIFVQGFSWCLPGKCFSGPVVQSVCYGLNLLGQSTATGRCSSGSIAVKGRWCSRSYRAAKDCGELRRRPSPRSRS